jgi:hypothetical protein
MDSLLIPDFVAANTHECFGCSLNVQKFIRRRNKRSLPVMPVFSLRLLAVVYNYGPFKQKTVDDS